MKIKLVVLHAMRDETFAFPLEYRLHAGHIGRWIYSVPGAARGDRNDIRWLKALPRSAASLPRRCFSSPYPPSFALLFGPGAV